MILLNRPLWPSGLRRLCCLGPRFESHLGLQYWSLRIINNFTVQMPGRRVEMLKIYGFKEWSKNYKCSNVIKHLLPLCTTPQCTMILIYHAKKGSNVQSKVVQYCSTIPWGSDFRHVRIWNGQREVGMQIIFWMGSIIQKPDHVKSRQIAAILWKPSEIWTKMSGLEWSSL